MLLGGQDVELLSPIRGVAVADQAQFLEDVEGPIHRGRRRLWILLATAFNQLSSRDVAARL
jgi:hypothetical protein